MNKITITEAWPLLSPFQKRLVLDLVSQLLPKNKRQGDLDDLPPRTKGARGSGRHDKRNWSAVEIVSLFMLYDSNVSREDLCERFKCLPKSLDWALNKFQPFSASIQKQLTEDERLQVDTFVGGV